MKIYFACTGKDEPIYLMKNNMSDILCSFHYYKTQTEFISNLIKKAADIFIDSGGFSADTLGTPINIDDYCKFLHDTKAKNYVVLDKIGDASVTYKNLQYMRKKGLNPFPVFHTGESEDWLLKFLETSDKIALGGMVGASPQVLISWLDKVWKVILNVKPQMIVHGFGITSPEVMDRYPWFSCDSSSFKSGKRFGRIIHYLDHKRKFYSTNFNKWVEDYAIKEDCPDILKNSKLRYEITDVYVAKGYTRFAEYKKTNKKDYSFLTSQMDLFTMIEQVKQEQNEL